LLNVTYIIYVTISSVKLYPGRLPSQKLQSETRPRNTGHWNKKRTVFRTICLYWMWTEKKKVFHFSTL